MVRQDRAGHHCTVTGTLARNRGQKGDGLVTDKKWGMDQGSLRPTLPGLGPFHRSLRAQRRSQRRGHSLRRPLSAAVVPSPLARSANTQAAASRDWARAPAAQRMRGLTGNRLDQRTPDPPCAPASGEEL